MSDDNEEIELLDFEDEENTIKKTEKPIVVKPNKNKEYIKEKEGVIEETIINEFLDNKKQEITTNNIEHPKMSTENAENKTRSKIIVAKKRNNTSTNKQNSKTKSNSGYIIIIGVIVIILLIMLKMILNVEEKHNKNYQENNKEINTKQKEENKNNNELTTTCKLIDDQTNQNIKTEKEISFVSVNQKIKKIIKREKEIYLTQDATYISKISTCSTNISEYNSYVGYNASCNIDDHNNTITIVTDYDLSKIDSNNIQLLKPPVLLDSNIQDVISNYSNMNYVCK